jgi:hypothetical protein
MVDRAAQNPTVWLGCLKAESSLALLFPGALFARGKGRTGESIGEK